MHARNIEMSDSTLAADWRGRHHATVRVDTIRPGQPFIRPDSPSEVLALMSFAGFASEGRRFTWAVVINVNHDSAGYVPGQLLKLRRDMRVRVVHEARPAHYALEQ